MYEEETLEIDLYQERTEVTSIHHPLVMMGKGVVMMEKGVVMMDVMEHVEV